MPTLPVFCSLFLLADTLLFQEVCKLELISFLQGKVEKCILNALKVHVLNVKSSERMTLKQVLIVVPFLCYKLEFLLSSLIFV